MPLSAPSRRAAPSWPVLTSKAGGTVSYLLCVQPAHRYWRRREDGADSGGAEEDECAEEAPGLLFCLHFLWGASCAGVPEGRSGYGRYGRFAELCIAGVEGERGDRG